MTTDEILALQEVVAGRFSIEREIGRGGMGVVYLARDVALDRPVAIKMLPAHLATEPTVRERFLREARTAAGLAHPNIVPIHAVEEHDDTVFFVMGFVDGETLRERVERRGRLGAAAAARLIREVAWALSLAHSRGIIHRDIKPDNILIDRGDGRAMVTDFGIARPMEASQLTGAGEIVGTVHYMSPEQASGDTIDGRSDLYSLGATAFYAVTGQLLFDGPHAPAVIARHLTEAPPPVGSVTEVPAPLASAIDMCLHKDREQRPADAGAFADMVGRSLPTTSTAPAEVRVFLRWMESFRTQAGTIGVISFGAGAALDSWAFVGVGAAAILALSAELVTRTRRLQTEGFTRDDVVTAIRNTVYERREEIAKDRPLLPVVPRGRLLASVLGVVSLAGGLSAFLITLWNWNVPVFRWWDILLLLTFGAGLTGIGVLGILSAVAPNLSDRLGAWFRKRLLDAAGNTWWGDWPGQLLFAVTRPSRAPARIASGTAPTERLVLDAADALVHELPRDVRRRLGDVNGVIHALEHKATQLRARQRELDDALAEAGAVGGTDAPRHAEMIGRLRDARDNASSRLGAVIAAMETIRIALIQLRAGVTTVDAITAELGRAQDLQDRIEAELELRDVLNP